MPVSESSERPTIVFVGGSLVHSGLWQEWLPEYRCLNFAVDGATTGRIATLTDAVVAEAPHAIVLLAGTDDLATRRTVELMVRAIQNILYRLRSALPEAWILVHSLVPRAAESAPFLEEINRHLWQFAPSVRAQYLDLWPALAEGDAMNPNYYDDRHQLNSDGYEAWLAELKPALERLLSQPPTSRPVPLPEVRHS